MKRTLLTALLPLAVVLTFVLLQPQESQAGCFSSWKDFKHCVHKGGNAVKKFVHKMENEVAKLAKKGIHDLDQLSGDVYKYVKDKLEGALHGIVRKLEGDDGYKPDKFKHSFKHAKSGMGNIRIRAVNTADITSTTGFRAAIKVGYKKISHTFHVNIGHSGNVVNYNSVVSSKANVEGLDISIDSKTSGKHHYYGIDMNIASIVF
jgi:hypothetical protein